MAYGVDKNDGWVQAEKEMMACSFCKESKKNVPRGAARSPKSKPERITEARYAREG